MSREPVADEIRAQIDVNRQFSQPLNNADDPVVRIPGQGNNHAVDEALADMGEQIVKITDDAMTTDLWFGAREAIVENADDRPPRSVLSGKIREELFRLFAGADD